MWDLVLYSLNLKQEKTWQSFLLFYYIVIVEVFLAFVIYSSTELDYIKNGLHFLKIKVSKNIISFILKTLLLTRYLNRSSYHGFFSYALES